MDPTTALWFLHAAVACFLLLLSDQETFEMDNQTTTCQHEGCSCQINTFDMEAGYPSKFGEFCSLACQQKMMEGDRCGCGHPGCA